MTRTFDLSKRLPDDIVQALELLDRHFRQARVPYVVIGAFARDAVTTLVQNTSPSRATKDLDLAVRVTSMDEFREVTSSLERVGQHEHRFRVAGLEIDVIPFGDLAADGVIAFRDSTLDVSGLAEAAEGSELVRVNEELTVDVASVASLALLKVLAWRDRRAWTTKDAIDLVHLFSAVESEPYEHEAWADEVAAETVDFDGSLLPAAWLGYQSGILARERSSWALLDVLARDAQLLAQDMACGLAIEKVRAFEMGFRRGRGRTGD